MGKIIIFNVVVVSVLILLFDIIMYFTLPASIGYGFEGYGSYAISEEDEAKTSLKNYYKNHESRGFDIRQNASSYHIVDGVRYPIWSNSIGCFDEEHMSFESYVYFAGDSFTWGFTPYEEKFGTVIERSTGIQILKCGVTHTGQKHQFEKFSEIVESVNIKPKAVFVFFSWNDVINDNVHPHSKIIDGWLFNTISFRPDYSVKRYSDRELQDRLSGRLESQANSDKGLTASTKRLLRKHSLTANIVDSLIEQMGSKTPNEENPGWNQYTFYYPTEETNGTYWYETNPRAEGNKTALRRFRDYSRENDIPLHVILIPPEPMENFDSNWYQELRGFLDQNGISNLDLTQEFLDRRYDPKKLYWRYDQHLSPLGNKAVAEIILERYPQVFSGTW